jgi:ABC-type uncharacterized transport system ATPase subunit
MQIELKGITKRFPGVVANDQITLQANSGEVLALVGENGAGKTTLMNILYGLYQPDEGEIILDGKAVKFRGPGDAIASGIGMVHQHFMLVPVFTVYENVILGVEPTSFGGVINKKASRDEVIEISNRYGLAVDPDALVEDLPVGLRQRVEIIKVLLRGANILVFDEPTSVLTPQEVEEFFGIVRELRDSGKTIIFITHKLKEAIGMSDHIVVLRGGAVAGTADPKTTTEEEVAALMVGRDVDLVVDRDPANVGEAKLRLRNLMVVDDYGRPLLDDVSFDLRAGEIVGVAGVQGNGQTELVEVITGLRQPAKGTIEMLGRDVTFDSTRKLHELGMAHVPEDRQEMGMVGSFSVMENLVLDSYYSKQFSGMVTLNRRAIEAQADHLVEQYDIRPPLTGVAASTLSGGNQQKMIVAREFSREAPVVICSQPTRGVDVGSIEYIHSQIVDRRDRGAAVLVVSTELDEVMALSDRILVMFEGRIVAERVTSKTTPAELGLYMAGRAQ